MAKRRRRPAVRGYGVQSAGYTARRNREPLRRRVPPSSCLPALALAPPLVLPRSPSCHPPHATTRFNNLLGTKIRLTMLLPARCGAITGSDFASFSTRSEEHTSELQSQSNLV